MSLGAEEASVINVIDVVRGIWRRKLLILALPLVGLALGSALVLTAKSSYQTEAQVILQNTATSFERATSDQIQNLPQIDDREVSGQISVMKSGDLLGRVVDSLGLDKNPEFNPTLKPIGTLKSLLIAGGFSDDPRAYTPRENAIKTLNSKVTISAIPETAVIAVTSRMNDPKAAADSANAIVEYYIAATRDTEAGSTERARQWLGVQITDLRKKVSDSENAVERYRSEAGLLKGQTTTLNTQQISELNTQIGVAETAAAEAKARADEIRSLLSAGGVESSSDVLSSPLIQNLREQQSSASRKVSELSAVYLPNHPKMIAAQKELGSINTQIRREALKVVDSLQGQAKVANARAEQLRANLENLKGRESDANISDVKLKSLEREAQANRTLLESMLVRYADANARQDSSQQPSKARIIQKAGIPPTPYFPKVGPTILLATIAGLALGLGLAFILEVMALAAGMGRAQRTNTRQHVASGAYDQRLAIPPLLIQPHVAPPPPPPKPAAETLSAVATMSACGSRAAALEALALPEGDEAGRPPSAIATALMNACLSLRDNRAIKTFSFTSMGCQGPDAALAMIQTARALAEQKKRVVIVDVSQVGGDVEMLAGLPAGVGLADMVMGNADFTKIINRDPQSTVHVVRKGLSNDQAASARVTEKIESVITALNTIYEFVFIHSGEAFAGTPALVKACPAAFILATAKRQRDALAAARVLETAGVMAPMLVQVTDSTMIDIRKTA